ncbi:MAG TPA: ribonuclease HI family protein [Terriglobales bacterium]
MTDRTKVQDMFGAVDEKDSGPCLVANIDGGARGNPGPAGYGVSIEDESGKRIDSLYGYLGIQTNNFAEYSGLLAALEYALSHNYRNIKIRSDSELLVKQIKGEYKVRSEVLFDIFREAKELIRKFDSFQIRHVMREQNREADRLANKAMDEGTGKKPDAGSQSEAKEVVGYVRDGVVHFLGDKLPEGSKVLIRVKR